MKADIIQIGNSKGLRLSKTILQQYNIGEQVELILEENYLILKPIDSPRAKWSGDFQKMGANGDDTLLIDDLFIDENLEQW
jgi:antitoxin MazE